MTTVLHLADLHKIKILEVFDSKDAASFERTLTNLGRRGQRDVIQQAAFATALLNIRDDRLGATVDLAYEIVTRQIDRCNEYGKDTHPLSEKQIAVIAQAAAKALRPDLVGPTTIEVQP